MARWEGPPEEPVSAALVLGVLGLAASGVWLAATTTGWERGVAGIGTGLFTLATIALAHRWRHGDPLVGERREALELDAQGVSRRLGDRLVQQIRWVDLVEVGVLTTADGPAGEDLFLLLLGPDGTGVAVPNAAIAPLGLLERLTRLRGVDLGALVAAAGSTEEASFVVWRGPPGAGEVCCVDPAIFEDTTEIPDA